MCVKILILCFCVICNYQCVTVYLRWSFVIIQLPFQQFALRYLFIQFLHLIYCVIKSCLYLDVKVCSCFLLVINKDLICRWVLVMCRQRRQAELPNVLYTTRWAIKVIKTNFYLIFQVSAAACWGCSGNYCVFCSKFLHFPVVKACPR